MGQIFSSPSTEDAPYKKIEAEVTGSDHIFTPTMFIMKKSCCDSAQLVRSFCESATASGVGSNEVVVSFREPARIEDDFPKYVYQTIKRRLDETDSDKTHHHWFFVYHPLTRWHSEFGDLAKAEPLDERFCGFTDEIDTTVLFMKEVRQGIKLKKKEVEAARLQSAGYRFIKPLLQQS